MPTPNDATAEPCRTAESPPGEADLIASLREGDRAAFSELYERHATHVYSLARKVLRSEADAETVVSDVFYEMWRKPGRLDESRGTCRTYLMVLTRSRALDLLRKRKRRQELTGNDNKDDTLNQAAAGDRQQPETPSLDFERNQQVRDAVLRLDEKQREPLQLAFFGGLTHQQIAERLDQPLGTIKTRIRSAVQTLRTTLKSFGRHDDELP